jgi:hypothetical protein
MSTTDFDVSGVEPLDSATQIPLSYSPRWFILIRDHWSLSRHSCLVVSTSASPRAVEAVIHYVPVLVFSLRLLNELLQLCITAFASSSRLCSSIFSSEMNCSSSRSTRRGILFLVVRRIGHSEVTPDRRVSCEEVCS